MKFRVTRILGRGDGVTPNAAVTLVLFTILRRVAASIDSCGLDQYGSRPRFGYVLIKTGITSLRLRTLGALLTSAPVEVVGSPPADSIIKLDRSFPNCHRAEQCKVRDNTDVGLRISSADRMSQRGRVICFRR